MSYINKMAMELLSDPNLSPQAKAALNDMIVKVPGKSAKPRNKKTATNTRIAKSKLKSEALKKKASRVKEQLKQIKQRENMENIRRTIESKMMAIKNKKEALDKSIDGLKTYLNKYQMEADAEIEAMKDSAAMEIDDLKKTIKGIKLQEKERQIEMKKLKDIEQTEPDKNSITEAEKMLHKLENFGVQQNIIDIDIKPSLEAERNDKIKAHVDKILHHQAKYSRPVVETLKSIEIKVEKKDDTEMGTLSPMKLLPLPKIDFLNFN